MRKLRQALRLSPADLLVVKIIGRCRRWRSLTTWNIELVTAKVTPFGAG